jgi:multiple sugar transport system permease protein
MLRTITITKRPRNLIIPLSYIILSFGAFLFLLPFIWMFLTSLKTMDEAIRIPPVIFPAMPQWNNYTKALTDIPFFTYYLNTIVMTVGRTVGQLFFCSLAAYAFARIEFPGRGFLFVLMLSILMVPGYLLLLPQYMLMKNLGWLNSFQALIVPGMFSSFSTFLLRQYFMTLPRELDEAARLDGANHFQIYWKIIIPLAKPALITMALFTILWSWNDLLWPLVVNDSVDKWPLSVGLASMQGVFVSNFPLMMAGTVIASWPIIMLFASFQRYFVRGIAISGFKG